MAAIKNPESRPVCLVTGGSSGIGLATARLFAGEGYDVGICGRDEAKLAAAEKQILQSASESSHEVECLVVVADLTDVNQARKFINQSLDRFSRIDVLVNNASVAPLASFEEITEETFEATINVAIRSLFDGTQIAWEKM